MPADALFFFFEDAEGPLLAPDDPDDFVPPLLELARAPLLPPPPPPPPLGPPLEPPAPGRDPCGTKALRSNTSAIFIAVLHWSTIRLLFGRSRRVAQARVGHIPSARIFQSQEGGGGGLKWMRFREVVCTFSFISFPLAKYVLTRALLQVWYPKEQACLTRQDNQCMHDQPQACF